MAVSEGAEKLAVSERSIVRIWDLASRALTLTFQAFQHDSIDSIQFNAIAFSPDLRMLATPDKRTAAGTAMPLDLSSATITKKLSTYAA